MSINEEFEMVKDFHKAFNHPYAEIPTLMGMDTAKNRYKWMQEEIDEFLEATEEGDLYEQVDAMIDVMYFALGTLVQLGVSPAEVFKVVQDANMSKLWEDGKPRFREGDGKVIKPPTWKDPHDKIREVIDSMGSRA